MKILVINPGSTSTKIAVFEDEKQIFKHSISHSLEELADYKTVIDQLDFRRQLVLDEIAKAGLSLDFAAVIGRGGLLKPLEGGTYEVNELMKQDIRTSTHSHASDLGCLIASDIAATIDGCRSFIADPVVVDELCDEARISGSPLMPRISIWHALNQKAMARRFAKDNGKRYEDLNLIVCHLGGGISVAAHKEGRCIDVNNALDGEGPMAPERAGTLPAADLVRLCFSGKYDMKKVLSFISGKESGMSAHLGTNDMREVENRVNAGDEKAKKIVDAMIYHVAKSIAAQGAVFCGKVDGIIITGGIAHWKYIAEELTKRVSYLAPVHIYAGEDELEALALNALAVIRGEQTAKEYK